MSHVDREVEIVVNGTPISNANPLPTSAVSGAGSTVTANQGTAGASAWPVSAASLPLPTGAATETTLGGVLKEGTDITGVSMPAGGASGRGWLSALWKALTDRLPTALISNRLDVNLGAAPAALTIGAAGAGPYPTTGFAPAAPTLTFTRAANQTPYTVGDEVGTASTAPTTVSVARINGGGGIIQGAQVVYSSAPAITPSLVLLIFSQTVTLAGDNAQLNLSDADAAKCVGWIPLTAAQPGVYVAGAASTAGNLILSGAPNRPIHFVCGGSETTLYCALITLNAWTPIANSETAIVTFDCEQN